MISEADGPAGEEALALDQTIHELLGDARVSREYVAAVTSAIVSHGSSRCCAQPSGSELNAT